MFLSASVRPKQKPIGLDLLLDGKVVTDKEPAIPPAGQKHSKSALTGDALAYLRNLQEKSKTIQKKQRNQSKFQPDLLEKTAESLAPKVEQTAAHQVDRPLENSEVGIEKQKELTSPFTPVRSGFREENGEKIDSAVLVSEEEAAAPVSTAQSISTASSEEPLGQIHSFASLEIESQDEEEYFKLKPAAETNLSKQDKKDYIKPKTDMAPESPNISIALEEEIPSEPYDLEDFEEDEDISSSSVPEEPTFQKSSSTTPSSSAESTASSYESASENSHSIKWDHSKSSSETADHDHVVVSDKTVQTEPMFWPMGGDIPPEFVKTMCLQNYTQVKGLQMPMRMLIFSFLRSQLDIVKSQARTQTDLYLKYSHLLEQMHSNSKITSETVLQKLNDCTTKYQLDD